MSVTKIALISLISEKHSVLAENYGISVLAGYLLDEFNGSVSLTTFDQQFNELEEITLNINTNKYDIIGFSVPIGTLSSLFNIAKNLSFGLTAHIILGGVIPTHRPIDLLKMYFPTGIACIGEGELALSALVRLCKGKITSLQEIPNIAFINNGIAHFTESITLNDLSKISNPLRSYAESISSKGGQVYIESSRGCSWNKCTFCAIREKGRERRSVPVDNFISNFSNLLNITQKGQEIVLTDEEFMGTELKTIFRANNIAKNMLHNSLNGEFYVATSVKSIVNFDDDTYVARKRKETLFNLKKIGLGRIFLGVESGSTGQLKRYTKGTKPEENLAAISLLRNLGIDIDIGMILFDPLMTLDELNENINFIEKAKIIGSISVLAHEVRIQENTPLLRILKKYEQKTGQTILGEFNINTLNYPIIDYKNSDIKEVVRLSISWQEIYYEFWYALKGRIRSISPLSKSDTRTKLSHFFKLFQQLELDFIKAVCEVVASCIDNVDDIVCEFEKKRMDLFYLIYKLISDNRHIDSNKKILEGINLYYNRVGISSVVINKKVVCDV